MAEGQRERLRNKIMFIKKLELQGFKSFPERTKILLHPGITAIIGPNGTGKSNIVDSILWVLGGQKFKSLRGEKIEDIIFNGNTKKAPLGMADVSLFLGNEEEELTINHRAFRSGESEYRLNGKSVRLKDIQDTLWKKAIAEKEYFVIEQGAFGLFLTSKPAEKRLLLEEAAGTAFYKDKKKQAETKLQDSEENLVRLEDIIAEVAKTKNSLQRQAQAAARYRKLRERVRELTSLHYARKIEQLEKTQAKVTQLYNQYLDQEREIASRAKQEEKRVTLKRKELWDLEKDLKEGQEKLFALKSQVTRAEGEIEKETRRIEFFEEKRKKAKANIEEFTHDLELLEKELAGAEKDLAELEEASREKQEELGKARQGNISTQERLAGWGKSLQMLKDEYLGKLSRTVEMKNEGLKIEKELELVLRQEGKLRERLEKSQMLLKEKEKKLAQDKEHLAQAQTLKEQSEKRLVELQGALAEVSTLIEKEEKRINELKEKKDKDSFHLQALKKLETKERKEDYSQMPGTLGLLADLIETSPEDTLLIDIFWKEEVKSPLILAQDFLKNFASDKIKGNFLLLSPQRKEQFPAAISSEPSVVGLLKSRLKPNPKIKDYLPHLEEAVIVQDIKSAVELWLRFPALNYISLKGDLLLHSGLLRLSHGEEGFFALSQEIKKLEEKIAFQDSEILPFIQQLEEKNGQKKNLEEKLEKEAELLATHERDVQGKEKEIMLSQAEKEKTANDISLLSQELSVLVSDKQALSLKMEDFSGKIRALEEEEFALKEKVAEEEKESLFCQEKNSAEGKYLLELKGDLDLLQEKIKNRRHQIQSDSQRKETVKTKIHSLEEEITNFEKEEAGLKQYIVELNQKIKKLEEDKGQEKIHLAQKEERLQKSQRDLEELEKDLKTLVEDQEKIKEERVKWEISKAETERDLLNLEEICWQELKKSLKEVKEEIPIEKREDPGIEEKLRLAKEAFQKFKEVNLMAEEEYLNQKKRFDFLLQQKKDLRESIDTTQEALRKIDEESKNQFLKALSDVNKNFQEVFSLLFNGGTSEVRLLDAANPLESGVEIIAQPPGKRVQNMMLLSGGEKSLTGLAFFFALFRSKPTPFCILDEVDAALDDVNLARFLEMMKKIKNETQFIIITHNYKTMEVADYIYGTTMAEPNITQLYSMKIEKKETA